MRAADHPTINVMHVITGLEVGGAETMLLKLVSRLDHDRFSTEVVSLMREGPLAAMLTGVGVKVRALGMNRGVPDPRALARLTKWMRESGPHIVQTWLYHADFLGGLAARSVGIRRLIWSVRQSDLSWCGNKWSTLLTARACAALSHWLPERIVCCSETARRAHERFGYCPRKMLVIPNGFDLERFRPNPQARGSVRAALGIPDHTIMIGLVARFDPQKDHRNFIEAARRVLQSVDARFVMCGEGVSWNNSRIIGWLREAGIADRCHLMGLQNTAEIVAALDIAVSSSFGEGFSNVIGESMACGVPCVVTDVGDSAFIVGDSGRVVPPRNPDALAHALLELIRLPQATRHQLGSTARQRVASRFGLPLVVRQYERLYEELLPECAVSLG